MSLSIEMILGIGDQVTKLIGGLVTDAKGVKDLFGDKQARPDVDTLRALSAELYSKLLETQSRQFAIQKALLELDREQKNAERFAAEAVRYALEGSEADGFFYALQPAHAGAEPFHRLCAECFQKRVKSILQPARPRGLHCPNCGLQLVQALGDTAGRGLETGWDALDPWD